MTVAPEVVELRIADHTENGPGQWVAAAVEAAADIGAVLVD